MLRKAHEDNKHEPGAADFYYDEGEGFRQFDDVREARDHRELADRLAASEVVRPGPGTRRPDPAQDLAADSVQPADMPEGERA
jgi:hypothetical protein